METQQEKYQRATAHVQKVKKFYSRLINSLIFIAIVAVINYFVNEFRNPWVLWVIGFSLLGIIIDAIKLFGLNIFLGKGWEQRKIEEHLKKEEQESQSNTLFKK